MVHLGRGAWFARPKAALEEEEKKKEENGAKLAKIEVQAENNLLTRHHYSYKFPITSSLYSIVTVSIYIALIVCTHASPYPPAQAFSAIHSCHSSSLINSTLPQTPSAPTATHCSRTLAPLSTYDTTPCLQSSTYSQPSSIKNTA